ncbi:MAG: septal ring lytic transglycosylase RlpA family protein [Casimicrobiaceae bacterium]
MNFREPALLAFIALTASGVSIGQAPIAAPPAPSPAPVADAPVPTPAAKSADRMEGLASVYSDKLNGRKTASGQLFQQSELTAAHPSLPFGTKVKVTNTQNNKSVEVRINDRGPNQAGRVIDLSTAAAAKLGMKKTGTAPVKLEVTAEAPPKKK